MSLAALDPLLQPFDLGPLHLRNRVVSTSHEPAYGHDGMPKERYRLYHREKAKGGVALTMIGGSAIIAPDSPPAFGNLHLYKDEIVPWFRELADDVHEHGAAVMIQVTHLGRRTSNYTGDWLPTVAASPVREPAHRAVQYPELQRVPSGGGFEHGLGQGVILLVQQEIEVFHQRSPFTSVGAAGGVSRRRRALSGSSGSKLRK